MKKQQINPGDLVSFPTETDLSAKQFYGAKLSSGLLIVNATKGGAINGVIQDKDVDGSTNQVMCQLQKSGIGRVKAAGTISEGNNVICDASGTFIADDGANQFVVGKALEAAVTGDIFAIQFTMNETTTS